MQTAIVYLPVENIELLSRYGYDSGDSALDKLGGVAWQARKARIKGRIKVMAEQLMKIAAQRQVTRAEILSPPDGALYRVLLSFWLYRNR